VPNNDSIQLLGESVRRDDIQRMVIDDPNGRLSVVIRLKDDSVYRIDGEEARKAIDAVRAIALVDSDAS
jgi:hypothetical protein